MANEDDRTVYCGNLSDEVTDEILYELFLQAGPIATVRRPKNESGSPKPFAFILYKYESAVPYALNMFSHTKLFNRLLKLNSRSTLRHHPVLQTDFSHPNGYQQQEVVQEQNRHHHRSEKKHHHRENERSEPKSWAEYNSLRGHGVHSKGYQREDLRRPSEYHSHSVSSAMPDFNTLLQMGQQLMLPGVGFPAMLPVPPAGMFDMPGGNMFAGSGRDRERRDHREHDDRSSRRDHPYNDRRDDSRHHDRRYSSSHSSRDREKRDRRSR